MIFGQVVNFQVIHEDDKQFDGFLETIQELLCS
jgi:hypothetical protein